jgi:hypothetical protein
MRGDKGTHDLRVEILQVSLPSQIGLRLTTAKNKFAANPWY